jgi:hypothetical protein
VPHGAEDDTPRRGLDELTGHVVEAGERGRVEPVDIEALKPDLATEWRGMVRECLRRRWYDGEGENCMR